MPEPKTFRIVLSTCPNVETAEAIARALVQGCAAACVNIVPGVRSFYRWQDALQLDEELMLVIKTRVDKYPEVERTIRECHPYELPEIVCVPIDTGLPAYLDWIDSSVEMTS
jgi:periplasmic divalent cation tolerance protein